MKSVIVIGLGGFIGTIVRFGLTNLWSAFHFPISALYLVNGLGSFVIGCLFALSQNRETAMFSFLTIGFLGGFTTFSSFSIEAFMYFKDGRWIEGLTYTVSMTALCILSTGLGYFLIGSMKSV